MLEEIGRHWEPENTCPGEPALISLERRPGSLKGDTKKGTEFGVSRSRDHAARLGVRETSRAESPVAKHSWSITTKANHEPGSLPACLER